MNFDLGNWFADEQARPVQPPRPLPERLQGMLSNFSGLNGTVNYGVYMPRGTSVVEQPLKVNAGEVRPGWNRNLARMDPAKYTDQYSTMNTMFHEAAHTVQKGTANYDKLKGIPFSDYDGKDTAPPEEILATLRAEEAKQKAGTTIWQTGMGKEVLEALMAKNPTMSKQGVQRYVDTLMFPEHSSLHPSEDSNPTDKPAGFWRASASLLKRLKP